MIRSTCATLFAFVLATVAVTSPQSTEAKDRRCQPRCCPQPVHCQPRAACCQPAPTCCVPLSSICGGKDAAPYFCAYFQYGYNEGIYYYYAPHCPATMTPISLSSSDSGPADNECDDNPSSNPLCGHDGSYRALKSHGTKPNAKLNKKLNAPTKLKGNDETEHYRRIYVGADERKPPYVSFAATLPNLVGPQAIVAQLWQYDITSKSTLPHHNPIRVQIGQEVKNNLPGNAVVLPYLRHSATDSPYVFDVTVLQDGREVTYQVVTSENRSNE